MRVEWARQRSHPSAGLEFPLTVAKSLALSGAPFNDAGCGNGDGIRASQKITFTWRQRPLRSPLPPHTPRDHGRKGTLRP